MGSRHPAIFIGGIFFRQFYQLTGLAVRIEQHHFVGIIGNPGNIAVVNFLVPHIYVELDQIAGA